ncbi:MAG: hypothetical protein J7J54_01135 [Candidatus Omnitrophica bacterium]|nr:hypothetical protein [Candidatus Omnitrophota bacterium]
MEKYNSNVSKNATLFKSEGLLIKGKERIKEILNKYVIKDMNDWSGVNADLIITDPPFGIEFSGKPTNYHRNVNNVVDGYVEWSASEYGEKIQELLECIKGNLKKNGQALIFSGWNNSNIIYDI